MLARALLLPRALAPRAAAATFGRSLAAAAGDAGGGASPASSSGAAPEAGGLQVFVEPLGDADEGISVLSLNRCVRACGKSERR